MRLGLPWQVSGYGEGDGQRDGRVDGRYCRLRPAKVSGPQGSSITLDRTGQRDGQKQHEEGIQTYSLGDPAVQQSSKRARDAASGAVDVKILVDGAGGIEACTRRRIKQQQRAQQQRGC